MNESNLRLQKIFDFVKARQEEMYFKRDDRDLFDRDLVGREYRWRHTLRVSQWGKKIAIIEGADIELVVAACLLHDIASFDVLENDNDHGRAGAIVARPFLQELGYLPEQVENICTSVAEHVDVQEPSTLEARIVTDADNIDRFGAYRVLYLCQPKIKDYLELTEFLQKRVGRLEAYLAKNPMQTKRGQEIFEEQLKFQINFFRKFIEESDSSVLPVL
jgi:HD superfamily phosphodiesterase